MKNDNTFILILMIDDDAGNAFPMRGAHITRVERRIELHSAVRNIEQFKFGHMRLEVCKVKRLMGMGHGVLHPTDGATSVNDEHTRSGVSGMVRGRVVYIVHESRFKRFNYLFVHLDTLCLGH